jgi:hypothetical protein
MVRGILLVPGLQVLRALGKGRRRGFLLSPRFPFGHFSLRSDHGLRL